MSRRCIRCRRRFVRWKSYRLRFLRTELRPEARGRRELEARDPRLHEVNKTSLETVGSAALFDGGRRGAGDDAEVVAGSEPRRKRDGGGGGGADDGDDGNDDGGENGKEAHDLWTTLGKMVGIR